MKHSPEVIHLPYKVIRTSLGFALEFSDGVRVTRRTDPRVFCTPPVENSNPSGVALAGADGQGVCPQFTTVTVPSSHVLTLAVLQFRRDWPFLAGRLSAMRAAA
jgi:hypothetical protein